MEFMKDLEAPGAFALLILTTFLGPFVIMLLIGIIIGAGQIILTPFLIIYFMIYGYEDPGPLDKLFLSASEFNMEMWFKKTPYRLDQPPRSTWILYYDGKPVWRTNTIFEGKAVRLAMAFIDGVKAADRPELFPSLLAPGGEGI
jgi:hypothetical protein